MKKLMALIALTMLISSGYVRIEGKDLGVAGTGPCPEAFVPIKYREYCGCSANTPVTCLNDQEVMQLTAAIECWKAIAQNRD